MRRKVGHVLHDILEAIERIEHITRGKTLADFEGSWELRWLVQRAIEIISEASRAIPDELKNTRPEIPWPRESGELEMCFATTMRLFLTRSFGM
jgi:uncharacterized protein with HEPN domain